MTVEAVVLNPGQVTLSALRRIDRGELRAALDPACKKPVRAASRLIEQIIAGGETVYGVNTGFGLLATTTIPPDRLTRLQSNLILSHSAGTGDDLPDEVVRLALVLKVLSLARGHSGVRWRVIEALLALLDNEVYPGIPAKGSVGASGDLAPLAHMAGVLLGAGTVRCKGKTMAAADGLKKAGLEPLELAPKEGLALLNGTQVSTALALRGLFAIEQVFAGALVAGALSVDAARGSDVPFDPRIHALRGQPGQTDTAAVYRQLLDGSEIRASHLDCGRVQDPYSLRCQPQVMGACLDHIRFAAGVLEREANAVTDNPLLFPDDGDALSGGNFHAEPVAMAADTLAIAAAEVGALSERRTALLVDATLSGQPPFLTRDGGVNSGFMIAQVTAAALALENKSLAHPASVDSLPTSANQEDHVSMATFAARRLLDIADNCRGIVAIELLAAAQGIDFLRPLKSSDVLETVHGELRALSPTRDEDRPFTPDIEAVKGYLGERDPHEAVRPLLPSFA